MQQQHWFSKTSLLQQPASRILRAAEKIGLKNSLVVALA
jgi:hypothetical protein